MSHEITFKRKISFELYLIEHQWAFEILNTNDNYSEVIHSSNLSMFKKNSR